jgi:aminoglycoside 3-N-acetyltransferase I
MSYTYAQLGPSDLAQFEALMRMFGEAFEDVPTFTAAPPRPAYVASLLAKSHVIVLAALDGSAAVGGLVAYLLEKFEQERSEIYIYDLAVAEPHRRRGIARALIHELQRIARDKGAYAIFVQADPPDAPAVALYTALGTREDVLHFDIEVPSSGVERS